ncbi:ATP-binding protein [Desulforhopalus sp. 52FAK]
MNTSQNKNGESTPFNPLRSIRVTIGSGILIQGLLFTAISVIALFGFYSFQNLLQNFSEKTFPLTTQEAQSSILMGQLLQQVNLLHTAESQQKRRIALKNINSQFTRIKQFSSANPKAFENKQGTKMDYLEQSITTLNNFVSKKIDLQKDLYTATTGLIIHSQQVHTQLGALLEHLTDPEIKETITTLEQQAFTVLVTGLQSKQQSSLYGLKAKESSVNVLIDEMIDTTRYLPAHLQKSTGTIVATIQDALLGDNGTITVAKNYLLVINEVNSRATFIRNLLENKGDSSMGHFFDLTTSVANDSRMLSDKVQRQIQILSLLFIVSLFLAIGYFIYFQRFLISRLTSLNKTVLAMVAGENLQIEDAGGDEITEIANSINYFSTELHEAKSVAERSAVQKSEFLAHMSHEIRTPLNAILGFSDLALMTNSPTEHLDYLSKINNASHSLLGIINSTLDISKIEAGKFTFDKVEFDLRNLLEDLSSIISLKCEESGLKFYYNIEPGTPYKIIGDPLRLSQILTNLVTNAFKFTSEGSITIHISAKNRLSNWKNKTTLLFSVEDTGGGISEKNAQQLFQPFTQADKSITRKFGGTGLGLAICKNLVEMMGGDIWFKQNELKGSTFSFTCTFELVDNSSFFNAPSKLTEMSAIVMSRTPKSATELSIQLNHFGLTIFQTLSIDEILAKIKDNSGEGHDENEELIFIDCEDLSFHLQEAVQSVKEAVAGDSVCHLILTGPQRLAAHFHSQHKQVSDYYLVNPITPARLLDAITTVLDINNPHCLQKQSIFNPIDTSNSKIHGGATILLVEDNEINSQIAVAYLKSRNLAVIVAHNGAEALEILLSTSGGQVNAVLMDIQMPVMDGYTATKAIRDLDAPISTIPIVALTAHAMPEEREKCILAGMDAYITKPINANDLFHTLSELIGEQIPHQQLTHQQTTPHSIPDNLLAKNSSLNMKTGLAQVMNDPALYMDLLMSFEKNYRGWPNDILSAFRLGDLEQCRHLVHTLKGVSGNLGMEKLFSLSVRLELCIRGNEIDSIQQLLDEVEEETGVVCDFLSDWLEQNKNNQWSSEESKPKLDRYNYNIEDLTEILSTSLKNNSSKALKQIQLLKSQLGDENIYVFNKIEQYAKELDFDKARDLLTEWQTQ